MGIIVKNDTQHDQKVQFQVKGKIYASSSDNGPDTGPFEEVVVPAGTSYEVVGSTGSVKVIDMVPSKATQGDVYQGA